MKIEMNEEAFLATVMVSISVAVCIIVWIGMSRAECKCQQPIEAKEAK